MKKIVVFGGTGFVGSFICKELAWAGYDVVSISKSGANRYLSDAEARHIHFKKGDIFNSDEWKEELNSCLAVVNCIGILFQKKKKNITYKRLIFETTKIITEVAKEKKVKNFIHISAVKPPSFILREYHIYKQRSEILLKQQEFNLLIVKPKIIVSPHKPLFLFFYRLQEIVPFYFKQFEPIENIAQQILHFLQK